MVTGKIDFTCPQGSTFSRTITYKINETPVNLTGYTSKLQVREYHYSDDYLVSLSSGNGMTLGGSAGTIAVLIGAGTTETFIPGSYVYDLEVTVSGTVTRLIEGKFNVTPEVTK